MPWLSILTALLAFFLSGGTDKKNRTRALAAAALTGVGTYYLSHETEWGQRTLGELDGYVPEVATAGTEVLGEDGKPANFDGNPIKAPVQVVSGKPTTSTGIWDVLKSWGPTGTAVVAGTAVAATNKNWIWLAVAAGAAILLIK